MAQIQWEYLFCLYSRWTGIREDAWRLCSVNGEDDPHGFERGQFMYEHAEQLGQAGWELVHAAVTARGGFEAPGNYESFPAYRLIFKRHREE